MITVSNSGTVRTLTLDNPGRRNAITDEGWGELGRAFRDFEASDQRCLVVTGAGEDFCAGADLSDSAAPGSGGAFWYDRMRLIADGARALHEVSKPTIAAIDGVAAGAGMNLALGCDILVATDRARFSEIFVKRGLTVDYGGTWLLPRRVGIARAKEMALTGRMVGAAEALSSGIASRLVPASDLGATAASIAADLAAGAPLAQRFIKAGFDRSLEMSFDQALAYEDQAQVLCLMSEDAAEGIASFLQRRPADFRGR